MGADSQVKRAAQRVINAAASAELKPMGLHRRGSSGRSWFDDHGWWCINVWFNPSAWSVSVSLSVGVQYYWQRAEHAYIGSSLTAGPVDPYRTGRLDGSIGEPAAVASAYAAEARRQVIELRETYADDRAHLRQRADRGWPAEDPRSLQPPRPHRALADVVTPEVALGRLDRAREHLARQRDLLLANPEPGLSDVLASLEDMVESLDPLQCAHDRVNQGRVLMGLDPVADPLPTDV